METTGKYRIYLVSFVNSRQYRLEFKDVVNPYNFKHYNPLAEVEQQISEYLTINFPDCSLAYYETPRVEEVEWKDRTNYETYPPLDQTAVKEIEEVLKNEIENHANQKKLDLNAPYAEINHQR